MHAIYLYKDMQNYKGKQKNEEVRDDKIYEFTKESEKDLVDLLVDLDKQLSLIKNLRKKSLRI